MPHGFLAWYEHQGDWSKNHDAYGVTNPPRDPRRRSTRGTEKAKAHLRHSDEGGGEHRDNDATDDEEPDNLSGACEGQLATDHPPDQQRPDECLSRCSDCASQDQCDS